MEEGWKRVTPVASRGKETERTKRVLPWLSAALLVPAVIMLIQSRPNNSHTSMAAKLAAFDAAAQRGVKVVKAGADTGMIQHITAKSKAALMHNVKAATMLTETNLAASKPLSSDKIQLRMFMESKCPGCRHFSTTVLKELLETPGFTDIVEFQAVPWGWGRVVEAPSASQMAKNDTGGNQINTTVALLSLLQGLGSIEQETNPFQMVCQHGFEECQGNAMVCRLSEFLHRILLYIRNSYSLHTCTEFLTACTSKGVRVATSKFVTCVICNVT